MLVQLACARVLTSIREEDFLDFSYVYRPERSAMEAVSFGYVVEAYIRGFFDNIDLDGHFKHVGPEDR